MKIDSLLDLYIALLDTIPYWYLITKNQYHHQLSSQHVYDVLPYKHPSI